MVPELLKVTNLTKNYDNTRVIKNVSLSLKKGEIGCLLGPSGCGKTTLLRAIAGFEDIHGGSITINDKVVSAPTTTTPPEKRRIGMVFQDYALFPHLSVTENIGFGLQKSVDKARRIDELLELVGLEATGNSYPHELSGGQQQRVALARALAPDPELLLLDEPFSNLDVTLRERLTTEVRKILKASQTTALMVTHNQHEAFGVADYIGVIFQGEIQQWDKPYNIYHKPSSIDVATFVGDGAIIKGHVVGAGMVQCGLGSLKGNFSLPCVQGCSINLLVRPEDILHQDDAQVKARVVHKSFRGPNILYRLELISGEQCLALVSSHHNHQIDEWIGIHPEVENLVIFPEGTGLIGEINQQNIN